MMSRYRNRAIEAGVNILVRATNWIGDAVMSLPGLRAIRQRFPDSVITVLAKPWVAALYEGERSIHRIIPLAGAPGARDWLVKWRSARALRREKFDLAVLFPNSSESAALARLTGAKRRVGYSRDGRGFLQPARSLFPGPARFHAMNVFIMLSCCGAPE